jgi:hypothetical protein
MPKSLYAAIPKIMDRFDFEKVEKVMRFLNWKWSTTANGYDVPSVAELESEAYRQLHECVRIFEARGCPASGMNVSSGGFQALVMTFEKGDPQLQLVFYVDEQDAMP